MLALFRLFICLWIGQFTVAEVTKVGIIERSLNRHRALFEKVVSGKKFEVGSQYELGTFPNLDLEECVLKCLDVGECLSFFHYTISESCTLLSVDRNTAPDDAEFVDSTGCSYYDTGFDITNPAWRKKSLLKLECTSTTCSYCPCIKEPGNGIEKCICWAAAGQLRYEGEMCLRANTGYCSSPDGMAIEATSDCSGLETEFQYNPDKEFLKTVCSNQKICPNTISTGEYIRNKDHCGYLDPLYRWFRIGISRDSKVPTKVKEFSFSVLPVGELMFGGYCFEKHGNNLIMLATCNVNHKYATFQFKQQAEGRAQVEVFKDCGNYLTSCSSKMDSTEPDYIRNVYNFEIPPYRSSSMTYIGFRVKTYFVAPMTGTFKFAIVTNDKGILYFGDSEQTKQQVIITSSLQAYDADWADPSRTSTHTLVEGQKYYMEGRLYEAVGNIWLKVIMEQPNGAQKRISHKYLVAYP